MWSDKVHLPYKLFNISYDFVGIAGHLSWYATHAKSLLFVCDFQAMHQAHVAICKDPKLLPS